MGISIPAGAFGPDPIGMGLDIGSNVYKGMKEGETATWQAQQQFDEKAHSTAIQDMANLVQIHGPDAVHQPEFIDAYQRAHKAQYPTVADPSQPGQQMPAPLGGMDNTPMLGSLGIEGIPPNLANMTVQQYHKMGGNVGQLILQGSRMTQGEYDAHLIKTYLEHPEQLNPAQIEYAKALTMKPKDQMSAEQIVVNYLQSHPNDGGLANAPQWIRDIADMHREKTPLAAIVDKIRNSKGGLYDPSVTQAERMMFLHEYGDKPTKPLTKDELIAAFASDKGFRDSLDPESRVYTQRLADGKGPQANTTKLYTNWQGSEQALTTARLEMGKAMHIRDEIQRNMKQYKPTDLARAETAVNTANAKFQEALRKRDAQFSIYDMAQQEIGGYSPSKGTVGQPMGGPGPQGPGRSSVSREIVDKTTQSIIDQMMRTTKSTPQVGMEIGNPSVGTAVFDGTNWRWK